jgi:hypothetical protein
MRRRISLRTSAFFFFSLNLRPPAGNFSAEGHAKWRARRRSIVLKIDAAEYSPARFEKSGREFEAPPGGFWVSLAPLPDGRSSIGSRVTLMHRAFVWPTHSLARVGGGSRGLMRKPPWNRKEYRMRSYNQRACLTRINVE